MNSEWLDFKEANEQRPRTLVVDVLSKTDGGSLGQVRWYAPWRHYCFFPIEGCVWSDRCLKDISIYVQLLNESHAQFRKTLRVKIPT